MNENQIFQILNSKWAMLLIGVLMTLALPLTYGNMMTVIDAGELSQYWWTLIVFLINLFTVIMAFFKFASKAFTKKESLEW